MVKAPLFIKTKDVSPMAILGNGYPFQIAWRRPPVRDSMGRVVIPMIIYPSKAMVEVYELERTKRMTYLRGEGMYIEFPKGMVKDLSNPDLRAVQTIVYCGLEEESTEMTFALQGLLEWDQLRDKTEDNLRAANIELQEEVMALRRIDATNEKLISEKRKAMGLHREMENEEEKSKGTTETK